MTPGAKLMLRNKPQMPSRSVIWRWSSPVNLDDLTDAKISWKAFQGKAERAAAGSGTDAEENRMPANNCSQCKQCSLKSQRGEFKGKFD